MTSIAKVPTYSTFTAYGSKWPSAVSRSALITSATREVCLMNSSALVRMRTQDEQREDR